MKSRILDIWPVLVLLTVVAVIGWGYHMQREQPTVERIPWVTDYATGQAQAAKSGKPVFLYFTATWCGPCQQMKYTTWSDSRVSDVLANFVPVKLDMDAPDTKPLAAKYHADQIGIPYFVVFDKQGNTVRTGVGSMPADMFLEWMAGKVNLDS